MRILHITHYSCIRTFKQALIMRDRGHDVDVLSPVMQDFGMNIYSSAQLYATEEQMAKSIQESRADILHVHTEPDSLVSTVKKYAGSRPVIFDWHDPNSIATTSAPGQVEKQAYRDADAIIHVSAGFRYWTEKGHGVGHKPVTIVHNKVPLIFYKHLPTVCWDAVCYEGGLTNKRSDDPKIFYFRNLELVVEKFIEAGFNVSLFAGANSEIGNTYDTLGAYVSRGAYYPNMLAGLRMHGFGFVGASVSMRLLNNTLPNKLYEYMSQGVVPVVWNADDCGRFVEGEGIGIWLKDLTDLKERLAEGPALREKLLKINRDFAMESDAANLERFYNMLI